MAAPVLAGTSAKQTIAPAPNPCLTSWFTGASVGYLTESENMMYNLHLGVTNSCWTVAGWNLSLFAEVGFTEDSWRDSGSYTTGISQLTRVYWDNKIDIDIVPITANIKFEHALSGNLNAYIGAGLGVAWIGVSEKGWETPVGGITSSYSNSDSDWVFTAQVFAGLSYNVSQACEIYGGGRWIYLANPNLMGASQDISDDWLLELGARYKF